MPFFRKKPVVIRAEQFTGEPLAGVKLVGCQFCWPRLCTQYIHHEFHANAHHGEIETLNGIMQVQRGEWVITGVNGEIYPCDPGIFEKTYEPVTDEEAEKLTLSREKGLAV